MKAANSKVDLCTTCQFSWPTCAGLDTQLEFGDGLGNDNVVGCDEHLELAKQPTTTVCSKG